MNHVETHVQEMVQSIFRNRQTAELEQAQREISEVQADHSRRGMAMSGLFIKAVMTTYEGAAIRTVERTLEELALQFRQAGRRDSTLFWNLVEPKIRELTESLQKSMVATAIQRAQMQGGANAGTITRIQAQFNAQSAANLGSLVSNRVSELRLKSQFITLKTPADRKANQVPDVAVMMWFPNPRTDKPEDVEAAEQRYLAIQQAVADASDGLATVKKFDDPSIVPQDRISASVETWLEKAVVVICDLGGQRHNVYYEFGYARALGTDVLLTCPVEDASATKLHLGHWHRVEYVDTSELKTKLTEKLEGLLSKYDLSGKT